MYINILVYVYKRIPEGGMGTKLGLRVESHDDDMYMYININI